MEAGKALDIVRTEVDLVQLVHDVHCIIEAMVGRNGEVRSTSAAPPSRCSPISLGAVTEFVRGGGGANDGCAAQVRLLQPQLVLLGPDGKPQPAPPPHPAHQPPPRIMCDPDRVRGILLNLYTNAAKFTKQGHIGLRVQEVREPASLPPLCPHASRFSPSAAPGADCSQRSARG